MSNLPTTFAIQAGQAVESVAEYLHAKVQEHCESPIETTFFVAFKLYLGLLGDPAATIIKGQAQNPEFAERRRWFIEPQVVIDDYRVDFMVGALPKQQGKLLIVECDGHDFHERTKEQAARDRARDRYLQAAGYKVFRFTGMEIHNRVFVCCAEVFNELTRWDDE